MQLITLPFFSSLPGKSNFPKMILVQNINLLVKYISNRQENNGSSKIIMTSLTT